MGYVFLILFLIASVIHLYHSWKNDARRRAYTKPLLLLFLLVWYLCTTPEVSWVLVAALLTSWLGDVLLIPKGHGWFTAGGISFLFSHFLFIVVYLPSVTFAGIPWLLVIPLALVYYGIINFPSHSR